MRELLAIIFAVLLIGGIVTLSGCTGEKTGWATDAYSDSSQPKPDIYIGVAGGIGWYSSSYGFIGAVSFDNFGDAVGSKCTEIIIVNSAGEIVADKQVCRTLIAGESVSEQVFINLAVLGGPYVWTHVESEI